MNKEKFIKWLKAAGIRAIKTVAETAVGMLTGNMVGVMDVDWVAVASVSALAGIISLLISIKGLPEVKFDEDIGEE